MKSLTVACIFLFLNFFFYTTCSYASDDYPTILEKAFRTHLLEEDLQREVLSLMEAGPKMELNDFLALSSTMVLILQIDREEEVILLPLLNFELLKGKPYKDKSSWFGFMKRTQVSGYKVKNRSGQVRGAFFSGLGISQETLDEWVQAGSKSFTLSNLGDIERESVDLDLRGECLFIFTGSHKRSLLKYLGHLMAPHKKKGKISSRDLREMEESLKAYYQSISPS